MKGRSNTAYLIKERRAKLRMSQQDLANALGVNRSTVSRYESGYIEKLPIDTLIPLARVLQTTPEYLMGWTDESAPPPFEDRLVSAYLTADENVKAAIRALLNLTE